MSLCIWWSLETTASDTNSTSEIRKISLPLGNVKSDRMVTLLTVGEAGEINAVKVRKLIRQSIIIN